MSSKFILFTVPEERLDVYLKLKDAYAYLASVVYNQELPEKYRLRAVHALNAMAKTLRLFIMDEEHLQELETDVEDLKQLIVQRID